MKPEKPALKACLYLTICMAAAWALCFWPARILNGNAGVQWMTIAAFCCLIPGWIVVFLGTLDMFPNELAVMLIQMSVRTSVVGAAIVIVKRRHPEFSSDMFLWWIALFYLVALFTEAALLLGQQKRHRRTGQDSKSEPRLDSPLTDSKVN